MVPVVPRLAYLDAVDRMEGCEVLGALLGDLWPYLIAACGAIAAIMASYAKGRNDASARAAYKDAQDQIDTRKRVDGEDYLGDDTRIIRDGLHKRGQRKRPVRRD